MNSGIPAKVKALILDMDGVLWADTQALLDMPVFFREVEYLGIPVVFATNNGTRSVSMYVERLASFGVSAEPWQVVNSSIATADYLSKEFPQGGPVFVVGEVGLVEALYERGFTPVQDVANPANSDILAVIGGMDRALSYDKLAKATLLIRAGKPFIFTNPDMTFPTPQGLVPGAGSIMMMLQAASGVEPVLIGKPGPLLYQFAMERLGTLPEETLAVGDRLDTDILGGQRAGCPTALVLSGVSGIEEARAWRPQPDLILPNLADLLPLLAEHVRRTAMK